MNPPTALSTGLALLRRALDDGAAVFRNGQWEAIDALVNRHERLLVVQRTGWGKSSVYFIATRILRDRGAGPTLIVSPLLALMRNQVDAARRLGIRALSINSGNREEWPALQAAIRADRADALLISPERLSNEDFVQNLLLPLAQRVGMLVVDEAHCISDWGHDFRPDYRRLVNVLRQMPANIPVIGTTATANNRVTADVQAQLGNIAIQRGTLMRESLVLQAMKLPSRAARLAWLGAQLPKLPGTGIIYALTKRDADQVAGWLNGQGIAARSYYSGVVGRGFDDTDSYRRHLEDQLLDNRFKALVATTALGMGYDKPDLGFVVHYQAPGSIIAYYQQVGRAGRAIDRAFGILMSGAEDDDIHEYFRRSAFPREESVSAILRALEGADGLTKQQVKEAVNLRHGQIEQALTFLSVDSPAPIIRDGARWRRTPIDYRLDGERIRRLTLQRESEWREMQEYFSTTGCLMEFLARALDDNEPRPCGKCANCLGMPVVERVYSRRQADGAADFLRREDIPLDCRKSVPRGAFTEYDLSGLLPAKLRAGAGRILSRWGDGTWGQQVAAGKHAGRFCDELVDAAAEMMADRWRPQPPPAWVTCVPSMNHPELVPDFAARLAQRLGLPLVRAVRKVRVNQPQKLQQNRFHQCRNLDGVFRIVKPVSRDPVLLIDDVVDSGWTMTVVAALLRQAGSGAVWPLALAAAGAGD